MADALLYASGAPLPPADVLLLIENSNQMGAVWEDLRDRYLAPLIHTKTAPATTTIWVLESEPLQSGSSNYPRQYREAQSAILDVQFNYAAENRISYERINEAANFLASLRSTQQGHALHLIVVAASSPSVVAIDASWYSLAHKLSQANVYCHLLMRSTSEDMSPLTAVFEETLRTQGNSEDLASFAVDSNWTIRLASSPKHGQFDATPRPPMPPRRNTFPLETSQQYVGEDPYLQQHLLLQQHHQQQQHFQQQQQQQDPTSTASSPTLVSQLQQVHGLTKKKVYGAKPQRKPFFRDADLSSQLEASGYQQQPSSSHYHPHPYRPQHQQPNLQSPTYWQDGALITSSGRVISQSKVDRLRRMGVTNLGPYSAPASSGNGALRRHTLSSSLSEPAASSPWGRGSRGGSPTMQGSMAPPGYATSGSELSPPTAYSSMSTTVSPSPLSPAELEMQRLMQIHGHEQGAFLYDYSVWIDGIPDPDSAWPKFVPLAEGAGRGDALTSVRREGAPPRSRAGSISGADAMQAQASMSQIQTQEPSLPQRQHQQPQLHDTMGVPPTTPTRELGGMYPPDHHGYQQPNHDSRGVPPGTPGREMLYQQQHLAQQQQVHAMYAMSQAQQHTRSDFTLQMPPQPRMGVPASNPSSGSSMGNGAGNPLNGTGMTTRQVQGSSNGTTGSTPAGTGAMSPPRIPPPPPATAPLPTLLPANTPPPRTGSSSSSKATTPRKSRARRVEPPEEEEFIDLDENFVKDSTEMFNRMFPEALDAQGVLSAEVGVGGVGSGGSGTGSSTVPGAGVAGGASTTSLASGSGGSTSLGSSTGMGTTTVSTVTATPSTSTASASAALSHGGSPRLASGSGSPASSTTLSANGSPSLSGVASPVGNSSAGTNGKAKGDKSQEKEKGKGKSKKASSGKAGGKGAKAKVLGKSPVKGSVEGKARAPAAAPLPAEEAAGAGESSQSQGGAGAAGPVSEAGGVIGYTATGQEVYAPPTPLAGAGVPVYATPQTVMTLQLPVPGGYAAAQAAVAQQQQQQQARQAQQQYIHAQQAMETQQQQHLQGYHSHGGVVSPQSHQLQHHLPPVMTMGLHSQSSDLSYGGSVLQDQVQVSSPVAASPTGGYFGAGVVYGSSMSAHHHGQVGGGPPLTPSSLTGWAG